MPKSYTTKYVIFTVPCSEVLPPRTAGAHPAPPKALGPARHIPVGSTSPRATSQLHRYLGSSSDCDIGTASYSLGTGGSPIKGEVRQCDGEARTMARSRSKNTIVTS